MANVLRVSPRGERKAVPNMTMGTAFAKAVLNCFGLFPGNCWPSAPESFATGRRGLHVVVRVLLLLAALLANGVTRPDCNRTYG